MAVQAGVPTEGDRGHRSPDRLPPGAVGPQWTTTGRATRATVLWGDQSCRRVQGLENANAAAGPAILGWAEQTDSCPGGGYREALQALQHLCKPACSGRGGRGKGARASGLPLPTPRFPQAPTRPGTSTGSHWDQRHLLGKKGMPPGPPHTRPPALGGEATVILRPGSAWVLCQERVPRACLHAFLGLSLLVCEMGRAGASPRRPRLLTGTNSTK